MYSQGYTHTHTPPLVLPSSPVYHNIIYSKSRHKMSSFSHYKVGANEQTPILTEPGASLDDIKIKVLWLTDEEMVFDLMGADASVANALRRILLAEVCRVVP